MAWHSGTLGALTGQESLACKASEGTPIVASCRARR
jgi:hypothetical protein